MKKTREILRGAFASIMTVGITMAQTTPTNPPSSRVPVFETTPVSTITFDYLDRIGLVDINRDGAIDVVEGPFLSENFSQPVPQDIRIHINNGDGTFGTPQVYDITDYGNSSDMNTLNSFISDDIDGDGDRDIVGVGRNNTGSILMLNRGDETFDVSYFAKTPRNAQIGARRNDIPTTGESLAFTDIDKDGDLDLFMSAFDSKDWSLLIFSGGTYHETIITGSYATTPVIGAYISTVADIDGDGDYDVIHHINGDRLTDIDVYIYENNNNTFTQVDHFTGAAIGNLSHSRYVQHPTADIDNDGDIDMITLGNKDGIMKIRKNNGSNDYTTSQTITLTGGIEYYGGFADIDGDNDRDLYFVVHGSGQTIVYENDGTGRFSYLRTDPFSYSTIGRDLNNDGYKDILSTPYAGNEVGTGVSYILGIAPYQFTGAQHVLSTSENYDGVSSISANTDTYPDLVVRHSQWPNNGVRGTSRRIEFYRNIDNDNDGLTNEQEKALGTSNINPDSDGDGIGDKEHAMRTDSDGDGVSDYDELIKGTNPHDPCNGSCTSGKAFSASTTTGSTATTGSASMPTTTTKKTTTNTSSTTGSTTTTKKTDTKSVTKKDTKTTPTTTPTKTTDMKSAQTYGSTNCAATNLDEAHAAYCFARKNAITTIDGYDNAMPMGNVYRKHFAKMMVNFSYNILNKPKVTKIPASCTQYTDMNSMDTEMQTYAQHACALGIMGVQADGMTPLASFGSDRLLTRAQFATVVSRVLRGKTYNATNKNSANWADAHLSAMNTHGYLTYITGDRLQTNEKRVFAWIVLHRIAEKK